MQQQHNSYAGSMLPPIPIHLGAHLRLLRDRHGLSQSEIVKHLPGWQQAAYSRIEHGSRAPMFESLPQIYRALKEAGVQFAAQDRENFLFLAQEMLESRKTRHARRSSNEWSTLRDQLAQIDGLPLTHAAFSPTRLTQQRQVKQTPRREIGHLLGREQWLTSVIGMIVRPSPMKVIVLQGPPGSGKTSEMHRLANYFLRELPRYHVVLSEPSAIQFERLEPTDVLEWLLADVLETVGSSYTTMPTTNLPARITYVLEYLTKMDQPVLIYLDNAEHAFDAQGHLALLWRRFLTQFMQASHKAVLIMASQEWPTGALLDESQLITVINLPPFSRDEGSQLLQTLGVRNTPEELLGRAVDAVGGVPLCLEWMVRLLKEPLLRDEWADFEEGGNESLTLERLLEDPALFGGSVAQRVQPLLDRLLGHLSVEAATALQDLALTAIPLGAPALKALYHSPKLLRELREASLLVAYPQRIQLLPMVAAQVRRDLTGEQVRISEERLIAALMHWLWGARLSVREQGVVITELASLLLRCHRLLAAAELILYYGWLSSHVGQMLCLARRVQQVLQERPWKDASENELETAYGALLLHDYLAFYLGEDIDDHARAEAYERILASVSAGQVAVSPLMQVYLLDHILRDYATAGRFEAALHLYESCFLRLTPLLSGDQELHATLLSKQAALYNRWSGYARACGLLEDVRRMQEQVITLYRSCLALLEQTLPEAEEETLRKSTLRKKQATFLNNLAYQLNMAGNFEEALTIIDACIELKERGYAERDSLAASYGEKSQILAALGQFQEALRWDERAREEIGRCVEAGDTLAQEEYWIYQVNQGRLLLLLGRVDEAQRLLEEAEPHIQPRRRIFQIMAQDTLLEIKQGKAGSAPAHYQLDWRWVQRYRDVSAYDAYWWWAHAGPFTDEEQDRWNQLFVSPVSEEAKGPLRKLLLASRDRELEAALAEFREPCLRYPAIEIDLVRRRIADFLALDAEISAHEPNAIVRRLYRGAIEDEVCFLQMIEATYEGTVERFWELTQQLYPPPTGEEIRYALDRVGQVVSQGLLRQDTREASQKIIQVLRDAVGCNLAVSSEMPPLQKRRSAGSEGADHDQREVSASTAKRFFEALLQESGYEGWRVVLDPNVTGPRIESGLRQMFVPDSPLSLEDIREYISHELLGHVSRSMAGEQSSLGLLAMGTRGYMATEEGIADYHERSVAMLQRQPFDDSGTWLSPLAVGLASGVVGHPLPFTSLFDLFEALLLVYRLLWRDDEDMPTAKQRARRNALTICLRTYRGVPDLSRVGRCFTKDVVYLRGHLQIGRAVAEDATVLDRLGVGKVALEQLPDLQELGIVAPQHVSLLRKRAYDPELDRYILAFEQENGRSLPGDHEQIP